MVDRSGKAMDLAPLLEGRQSVARNTVLGMKNVESPAGGGLEMAEVFGDSRLDHRRHVGADRRRGDKSRAAQDRTEEAAPPGVGRMHDGLMAKPNQRVAQFQSMDHAAARVGRVGEDRNPQGAGRAHATVSRRGAPINDARSKSQMTSTVSPSAIATSAPSNTPPMSAAAMSRSLNRRVTAPTSPGATARR
jgi:hypothetical protein